MMAIFGNLFELQFRELTADTPTDLQNQESAFIRVPCLPIEVTYA
jgi:hypothetical protein